MMNTRNSKKKGRTTTMMTRRTTRTTKMRITMKKLIQQSRHMTTHHSPARPSTETTRRVAASAALVPLAANRIILQLSCTTNDFWAIWWISKRHQKRSRRWYEQDYSRALNSPTMKTCLTTYQRRRIMTQRVVSSTAFFEMSASTARAMPASGGRQCRRRLWRPSRRSARQ